MDYGGNAIGLKACFVKKACGAPRSERGCVEDQPQHSCQL
jgi:hypothetical protein